MFANREPSCEASVGTMPCACPRPGEDTASASGRGQAQGIVPTHGMLHTHRPVFLRLQTSGSHPLTAL